MLITVPIKTYLASYQGIMVNTSGNSKFLLTAVPQKQNTMCIMLKNSNQNWQSYYYIYIYIIVVIVVKTTRVILFP